MTRWSYEIYAGKRRIYFAGFAGVLRFMGFFFVAVGLIGVSMLFIEYNSSVIICTRFAKIKIDDLDISLRFARV